MPIGPTLTIHDHGKKITKYWKHFEIFNLNTNNKLEILNWWQTNCRKIRVIGQNHKLNQSNFEFNVINYKTIKNYESLS